MELEKFTIGEYIGFRYLSSSRDVQSSPAGFYGRINSTGRMMNLTGRELIFPATNLIVNPEGNINIDAYELKDKIYVLRAEEETLEAELIKNPADLIRSLAEFHPRENLLEQLIRLTFPIKIKAKA